MVFNDIGTVEATLANIYSKLVNDVLVCGDTHGVSILMGSYADELKTYNTNIPEFQFYQNSLLATNLEVVSLWNKSYNLIYAANSIIEGLENSTISNSVKNRLIGEAIFLRTFIHFYLQNLFGEIPYVTSTDYFTNGTIGKVSRTEAYTSMINDLKVVKELMPVVNSDIYRIRASYDAVRSLLARVYLYNNEWQLAELEADFIINSGNYEWVDSLDEVFFKGSTGTIWQLMPIDEGLPTKEGQNFIFTNTPPLNRALSENLLEAFEPGDMRKEKWLGSVSSESHLWYFPYKYKQNTNESVSSEYSIMIRLEELYLIRAEARLKQGNLDGAIVDINKIRNRAGLPDVLDGNEDELMDAILQERRIELFSELGHRFFDLKRTGKINTVLSPLKLGWNSTDVLLPIPESELLLNPNLLPQNPGY
jgi:hypothetical protein